MYEKAQCFSWRFSLAFLPYIAMHSAVYSRYNSDCHAHGLCKTVPVIMNLETEGHDQV